MKCKELIKNSIALQMDINRIRTICLKGNMHEIDEAIIIFAEDLLLEATK